jgi:hypothetical protein
MQAFRVIMNHRPDFSTGRGLRIGTRRRPRRSWGFEALEGRALLSIYLVDSPGDAGTGTGFSGDLRYAIEQADQATGDSTIQFAPALRGATITLTSGLLPINKPSGTLTIAGPGADALTISGGGHGQVFTVTPASKVSISGMTITGGIGLKGGGILNNGTLTVSDCTITGNAAASGGGGGIANGLFGTMTIVASTISGNVSNLSDGAGISNAHTMTIIRSTISGNTAHVGNGGGIANTGTLTIGDSTVSGNRALSRSGGGIFNTSALTMSDDTVSNNTADISGGGLANQAFPGGTIALDNTIVAGNVSVQDARTADVIDNADFDGSRLVGRNNLIGSGDLGTLSHTLVGVDPRLGPLQENGGPTWTQALLAGSPAINAGDNSLVPAGAMTDQRGGNDARIAQGHVDIGAFEFQVSRRPVPVLPGMLPGVPLSTQAIIGLTIVPPSPSSTAGTAASGLHAGA